MTVADIAVSSRRGRPGYEKKDLLEVCVKTFNRYGYEATSMGMLAEELGITKSAIYHHVNSKEDILAYALDQALDSLEEVFEAAETLEDSEIARLEFAVRQTVFVLAEKIEYVTLLLRLRGNTELENKALERRRSLTYRLSDMVQDAQNAGQVREDTSARTIARLIFGMINSLAIWYRPERQSDLENIADDVVRMALEGVSLS